MAWPATGSKKQKQRFFAEEEKGNSLRIQLFPFIMDIYFTEIHPDRMRHHFNY